MVEWGLANIMKKFVLSVIFVWLSSVLAACAPLIPVDSGSPDGAPAGQYETVSVLLTSTAAAGAQQTLPPAANGTGTALPGGTADASPTQPQPVSTPSDTPDSGANPGPSAPQAKCDAAQAGRPIDISVPDETHFQPGEQFTKVWRVANSGNCAWTPDYMVVWFSGDDLGLTWVQAIGTTVAPGQTIDLAVDMAAPEMPGVYQSNWKLSNGQGSLFGIGPNGDAPFWVRIIVNPEHTATPEPTPIDPTPVAPPVILAQGSLTMLVDQVVDLNAWNSSPVVTEDLQLQLSEEEGLILNPTNGARLVYFGVANPTFVECIQAQVSEEPILLENFPPGAYYCFRTADEMPGRLMVSNVDTHNNQASLEFMTWVP